MFTIRLRIFFKIFTNLRFKYKVDFIKLRFVIEASFYPSVKLSEVDLTPKGRIISCIILSKFFPVKARLISKANLLPNHGLILSCCFKLEIWVILLFSTMKILIVLSLTFFPSNASSMRVNMIELCYFLLLLFFFWLFAFNSLSLISLFVHIVFVSLISLLVPIFFAPLLLSFASAFTVASAETTPDFFANTHIYFTSLLFSFTFNEFSFF